MKGLQSSEEKFVRKTKTDLGLMEEEVDSYLLIFQNVEIFYCKTLINKNFNWKSECIQSNLLKFYFFFISEFR